MFNRADYSTGPGVGALALGDLNDDGRMDVIVVNAQGSDSVSVLLAKPGGTFGPAVNYAVLGSVTSLAVGDFDNDGKLDVAVISGSQGTEGISILRGNGDGTLQQSIFFAAGQSPTGLAVGDFNADGRLDLAISDNGVGVNGVDILLGNGNGTFQTPISFGTANDPRMVVVGDFNNDNRLDLATVNSASSTVSVLLGNGAGTFQTHQDYSTKTNCGSLAVGDLRNVGKLDIVAGCQPVGRVSVLLSNGDGTFATAKTYSVPSGADRVAMGDFNGDGKLDVAVTSQSTPGAVSVLLGTSLGNLKSAVAFATGISPSGLAVGDFNGDGKQDLVTANSIDGIHGSISVLLSNGSSLFAGRSVYKLSGAQGGAYEGIVAADLNGDGKSDLVLGLYPAKQMSVLLNKGNGTFKPFVTYDVPYGVGGLSPGDFNNDQKVDVAVTNLGGSVSLFLNAGDGTFPAHTEFPLPLQGYGIAVGDFNKDGNLDIVVAILQSNVVAVLLGSGTASFQPYLTYATGDYPISVAVGDFNHDGWPDLAAGNIRDGTVSILLNKADGSGTFFPKQDYATGGAPRSIVVASFRGSGVLDLAVATDQPTGGLAILLGNNDGTFQQAVTYDTLYNAHAVATGDFDNDGTLDLAVAINGQSQGSLGFITLMLGKGDGTFSMNRTLLTGGFLSGKALLPFGVVAADFNNDGGLDLGIAEGTWVGYVGRATVLLSYPVVDLTPSSISFGTQKVGTTGGPQVVTVTNPGVTPLRISGVSVTGDFAETNNCPTKLASGKSCSVSVTFTPTATGLRTGNLTIKDAARSSPQNIALTGTGT